jgi:hypothetical protein
MQCSQLHAYIRTKDSLHRLLDMDTKLDV